MGRSNCHWAITLCGNHRRGADLGAPLQSGHPPPLHHAFASTRLLHAATPGPYGETENEALSPASALLSLLSALVSLRRNPTTVGRTSFPPAVLCLDAPFATPGPFEQVPRYQHYYEAIRLLSADPPPFLSMGEVLSPECLVRSVRLPTQVLGCQTAWPVPSGLHGDFERGGEASQVPGQLLRTCPALRPR